MKEKDLSISPYNILFFDGECNLCNYAIQFVINHDKDRQFRFANLSTPQGKELLQKMLVDLTNTETAILIERGKVYTKSDAVLQTLKHLDYPWPLLLWVRYIPKNIRDWIYTLVACHRSRIFGTAATCWVETEELQELFLA